MYQEVSMQWSNRIRRLAITLVAFDVKRVREEITNEETGTTFLLADDGLYLVRRPSVERDKESRELAARDAG